MGQLIFRKLTQAELGSASELLTQTNRGVTPQELADDLVRSLGRWPSLQIGAFAPDLTLAGLVAGRVDGSDPLLGWSDDIVVGARWRSTGLGSALLTRQLEAFEGLGCRRVRGLSPRPLYGALSFFERHGFRVVEKTISRGLWGIADGEELCETEKVL